MQTSSIYPTIQTDATVFKADRQRVRGDSDTERLAVMKSSSVSKTFVDFRGDLSGGAKRALTHIIYYINIYYINIYYI